MRREGSASAVFARSREMRAGLSMVNATGSDGRRRVMQRQLHLLPGDVLHVDRLELVRRALRVRGVAWRSATMTHAASHNSVEAVN